MVLYGGRSPAFLDSHTIFPGTCQMSGNGQHRILRCIIVLGSYGKYFFLQKFLEINKAY